MIIPIQINGKVCGFVPSRFGTVVNVVLVPKRLINIITDTAPKGERCRVEEHYNSATGKHKTTVKMRK